MVTSPTYTIISEYEAFLSNENGRREPIPFFHIDAYRLKGNEDFTAIGGEEAVFGSAISVIEWSDRIQDSIPDGAIEAVFEINADGKRIIRIGRLSK